MKCPKCGTEISVGRRSYDFAKGCPACGWRRSGSGAQPGDETGEFSVSPGELVVCWILTIPMVLGPYAVIFFLQPEWASRGFFRIYYWLGWGAYLVLAWLFSPEPDVEGPADSRPGWIADVDPDDMPSVPDTPTAWLALALAPGKIVLAALIGLPRCLYLALRLRARNRALEQEARQRLSGGVDKASGQRE